MFINLEVDKLIWLWIQRLKISREQVSFVEMLYDKLKSTSKLDPQISDTIAVFQDIINFLTCFSLVEKWFNDDADTYDDCNELFLQLRQTLKDCDRLVSQSCNFKRILLKNELLILDFFNWRFALLEQECFSHCKYSQ
jgi:hypothetical protein